MSVSVDDNGGFLDILYYTILYYTVDPILLLYHWGTRLGPMNILSVLTIFPPDGGDAQKF